MGAKGSGNTSEAYKGKEPMGDFADHVPAEYKSLDEFTEFSELRIESLFQRQVRY